MSSPFTLPDLSIDVRSRAARHVGVLLLAMGVLIGSFVGTAGGGAARTFTFGVGTDALARSAQTAIVARAIPLTSQPNAQPYVVKPGDSLATIAHQVGVTEEALLAYNGLTSSDALTIGTELRIPDPRAVSPDQLTLRDTAPHGALPLVGAAPSQSASEPLGPQTPSPDVVVHDILKGESVAAVAAQEGVSTSTILTANGLSAASVLQIGQHLLVPKYSGTIVLTKPGDTATGLAEKYGIPIEALLGANNLNPQTKDLAPGANLLIPADPNVVPWPTVDGSTTSIALKTGASPADSPQPKASTAGFIWPATGVITTYFSSWHNGIDIANSSGTPVRAAMDGTVTFSGWDYTGYGYMIRIAHSNGLESLYGHSSKLIARVGDRVAQGDVVMLMGSTGNSTGPHLHFSIFKGSGWAALNPLQLLP